MDKSFTGAFWISILAVFLACIASPAPAREQQHAENIVAVVNGTAITREDFDREMKLVQQRLRGQRRVLGKAKLLQVQGKVLENLINLELLHQKAIVEGTKVSDEAINTDLGHLKNRFSSGEEYRKALKGMNLSEASVRTQIERGLRVHQFIDNKFVQGVTIPDKEARNYYENNRKAFKRPEQIKASHILIKVDPESDESVKAEARRKIEEIRERVKKGEDFSTLAKEFSQGPSGPKGGDLGYFGRGQMVESFEKAAFALKTGQVSGIVGTKFGYHLIKVVDRKSSTPSDFEEVKEKIHQYLKRRKVGELINAFLAESKKKSTIERFLKNGLE